MTASKKIPVIDRGNGWICIEKPAGISVHNDPGKDLVSILSAQPESKGFEVLQPVHRLDRDTSGLLLLATDRERLSRLSEGFASGRMKKHYQALVHGNFQEDEFVGEWTRPLTKQAGGRKDPVGRGKKLTARTRYAVIGQSPHYALLEIALFTGRKHQIRRHAKLAGHPIVGDSRYGSPRAIAFLTEQKCFYRMALHACRLEFMDQGSHFTIESPALPGEIYQLFKEDDPAL